MNKMPTNIPVSTQIHGGIVLCVLLLPVRLLVACRRVFLGVLRVRCLVMFRVIIAYLMVNLFTRLPVGRHQSSSASLLVVSIFPVCYITALVTDLCPGEIWI